MTLTKAQQETLMSLVYENRVLVDAPGQAWIEYPDGSARIIRKDIWKRIKNIKPAVVENTHEPINEHHVYWFVWRLTDAGRAALAPDAAPHKPNRDTPEQRAAWNDLTWSNDSDEIEDVRKSTDAAPTEPAPDSATAQDATLQEIEARRAAATPGQWTTKIGDGEPLKFGWTHVVNYRDAPANPDTDLFMVCMVGLANLPDTEADAEFIANAPADIDFLLSELRKTRAAIADALTAANEGRWTTVKTLLEGGKL